MLKAAVGKKLVQKSWGRTVSVRARERQMHDDEFPKKT